MDATRSAMCQLIEESKCDQILHFSFGAASLLLDQNLCDAFEADVIMIEGLVDYAPGDGRRLMLAIFEYCHYCGFQVCVLTSTREASGFYAHIGMEHLTGNIYFQRQSARMA